MKIKFFHIVIHGYPMSLSNCLSPTDALEFESSTFSVTPSRHVPPVAPARFQTCFAVLLSDTHAG